ncbi:MAG: hypothetical protein IJH43_03535 [Mogibacterium sp.]|nr:hypothetical protein [Mogibacterium sp.]
MIESRKLKQWQKELNNLCLETNNTLKDICDYLDLTYQRDIGFYVKIPKKRRMFIGIGMALCQPVEVINNWITHYGNKSRLYSKNLTEDLIWIYLIECNLKQNSCADGEKAVRNYYREYDAFQQVAFETYMAVWTDLISGSQDTSDLDNRLAEIGEEGGFEELKNFVIKNIDSFKTAYAKPRRMLATYRDCILSTNGKSSSKGHSDSLISLRGWLDDSMINYLSGSPETVNVTNVRTGERVPDVKQIPKSRKSHIAISLALGMATGEIDQYLELMGYLPLNKEDPDDQILITELEKWETEHPLPRLYKEKFINGNVNIELNEEDEQQAVSEMLMLRQELRASYKRRRLKFDYMKS